MLHAQVTGNLMILHSLAISWMLFVNRQCIMLFTNKQFKYIIVHSRGHRSALFLKGLTQCCRYFRQTMYINKHLSIRPNLQVRECLLVTIGFYFD